MKVIILAGGTGTRLWPQSRTSFPKQFLHFGDEESFLQKTVKRFMPKVQAKDFVIVTNQQYYHLAKEQLEKIDPLLTNQIIVEPESKNTAPAILLGIKYMQEKMALQENECVIISPSDQLISSNQEFLELMEQAESVAKQGYHVAFGVRPHHPATGYGYIKVKEKLSGPALKVEKFVEKPSLERAKSFLLSGEYLWNSGIFVFRIDLLLQELAQYEPAFATSITESFAPFVQQFSALPNISIDYALFERSQRTALIPMTQAWSDVGSWDSVYDILEKDQNQNVKIGNVIDIDTKNSLIIGNKRLVSLIGVEDLLVIETDDAVFIGKKGESQKVKSLVDQLKNQKIKESEEHTTMHRPWGKYTILEEGDRFKIKRIVVNPLQQLSLQMHYHRSEHWIVVRGTAQVVIGDEEKVVYENQSVFIPRTERHRLANPGKVPLEIIEVQVGEYLGEDDIVRFQDIYGRTESLATK